MASSAALSDLGPALPPPSSLRAVANEAQQLIQILQHAVAIDDHLRAARTIDKLRALFGTPSEGAGIHG